MDKNNKKHKTNNNNNKTNTSTIITTKTSSTNNNKNDNNNINQVEKLESVVNKVRDKLDYGGESNVLKTLEFWKSRSNQSNITTGLIITLLKLYNNPIVIIPYVWCYIGYNPPLDIFKIVLNQFKLLLFNDFALLHTIALSFHSVITPPQFHEDICQIVHESLSTSKLTTNNNNNNDCTTVERLIKIYIKSSSIYQNNEKRLSVVTSLINRIISQLDDSIKENDFLEKFIVDSINFNKNLIHSFLILIKKIKKQKNYHFEFCFKLVDYLIKNQIQLSNYKSISIDTIIQMITSVDNGKHFTFKVVMTRIGFREISVTTFIYVISEILKSFNSAGTDEKSNILPLQKWLSSISMALFNQKKSELLHILISNLKEYSKSTIISVGILMDITSSFSNLFELDRDDNELTNIVNGLLDILFIPNIGYQPFVINAISIILKPIISTDQIEELLLNSITLLKSTLQQHRLHALIVLSNYYSKIQLVPLPLQLSSDDLLKYSTTIENTSSIENYYFIDFISTNLSSFNKESLNQLFNDYLVHVLLSFGIFKSNQIQVTNDENDESSDDCQVIIKKRSTKKSPLDDGDDDEVIKEPSTTKKSIGGDSSDSDSFSYSSSDDEVKKTTGDICFSSDESSHSVNDDQVIDHDFYDICKNGYNGSSGDENGGDNSDIGSDSDSYGDSDGEINKSSTIKKSTDDSSDGLCSTTKKSPLDDSEEEGVTLATTTITTTTNNILYDFGNVNHGNWEYVSITLKCFLMVVKVIGTDKLPTQISNIIEKPESLKVESFGILDDDEDQNQDGVDLELKQKSLENEITILGWAIKVASVIANSVNLDHLLLQLQYIESLAIMMNKKIELHFKISTHSNFEYPSTDDALSTLSIPTLLLSVQSLEVSINRSVADRELFLFSMKALTKLLLDQKRSTSIYHVIGECTTTSTTSDHQQQYHHYTNEMVNQIINSNSMESIKISLRSSVEVNFIRWLVRFLFGKVHQLILKQRKELANIRLWEYNQIVMAYGLQLIKVFQNLSSSSNVDSYAHLMIDFQSIFKSDIEMNVDENGNSDSEYDPTLIIDGLTKLYYQCEDRYLSYYMLDVISSITDYVGRPKFSITELYYHLLVELFPSSNIGLTKASIDFGNGNGYGFGYLQFSNLSFSLVNNIFQGFIKAIYDGKPIELLSIISKFQKSNSIIINQFLKKNDKSKYFEDKLFKFININDINDLNQMFLKCNLFLISEIEFIDVFNINDNGSGDGSKKSNDQLNFNQSNFIYKLINITLDLISSSINYNNFFNCKLEFNFLKLIIKFTKKLDYQLEILNQLFEKSLIINLNSKNKNVNQILHQKEILSNFIQLKNQFTKFADFILKEKLFENGKKNEIKVVNGLLENSKTQDLIIDEFNRLNNEINQNHKENGNGDGKKRNVNKIREIQEEEKDDEEVDNIGLLKKLSEKRYRSGKQNGNHFVVEDFKDEKEKAEYKQFVHGDVKVMFKNVKPGESVKKPPVYDPPFLDAKIPITTTLH